MKPVHHHFWMLFSLVDGQARIEAEGYIQINNVNSCLQSDHLQLVGYQLDRAK